VSSAEVISFKMAVGWITQLYSKLLQIRGDKTDQIEKITDLVGDPLELAKYYVEPDCQQFNPADDSEQDSNVIRVSIFDYIESTFMGGDKKAGTGKNQLFILSDAGMGKTSLLSIIWLSYLTGFWPKNYECKLIKLGPSTIEDIKSIKSKRRCFLLLDGLDEDSQSWGRTDRRIRELLDASKNFYRVAITCRTQFFSGGADPFNRRGHVELSNYMCPVVYLSLFSENQVDEYISRKFHKNSLYSESDRQRLKGIVFSMGRLRFRPMLLAHSEDLLQSQNESWNEYSVYQALISAWLHRELRKDVWSSLKEVPKIETLLDVASDLAFVLQKYKSTVLKEEYFENLVSKNENAKWLRFLDVGGRSFFNKNSEGEFRFSHYSVQEFLLAQGIIEGYFTKDACIRATDQIIQFLVTHLNSQGINHYRFPWHVLDLSNVSFSNLDLVRFNFSQVMLYGADFYGSDLSGTDFCGADLRNCNFRGSVNIEKANLNEAIYDESTQWPDMKKPPESATFIGPSCLLDGYNLSGLDFSKYDLRFSIITNTKFINCKLNGAKLDSAQLSEVNFSECDLDKTSFHECKIDNTTFNDAKGSDINFTGAGIKNSDLINVEFIHAVFDDGDLNDVTFEGAKIDHCSFINTELNQIDFSGASLSNVSGLGERSSSELEKMNIDEAFLSGNLFETIR